MIEQKPEPIMLYPNDYKIGTPATEVMRFSLDGGFVVNESIPATDAARHVLSLMKDQWFADAQATRIRELEDRIKRLGEAGDALSKTQTYDLLENVNWRKAREVKS